MKANRLATFYAIAAAALYAINVPFSKLLLNHVAPTMMAAFLYLGAGLGLLLYGAAGKAMGRADHSEPLTGKELPYTVAMVVLAVGEHLPPLRFALCTLLLGFVAYGLSIHFYIMAQKELGAAKTSVYYSIAPFLGVSFSMLLLGERPAIQFYVALAVMMVSTYFMIKDTVELQHIHEHTHTHTHEHRHGNLVHSHEHSHTHTHLHVHGENADNHDHLHRGQPHRDQPHEHRHCA